MQLEHTAIAAVVYVVLFIITVWLPMYQTFR